MYFTITAVDDVEAFSETRVHCTYNSLLVVFTQEVKYIGYYAEHFSPNNWPFVMNISSFKGALQGL